MSLISEFHNNDFAAYNNIPTSWKETGLDPAKVARNELGNAVLPQYEKDSFIRKAQTQGGIPKEAAKSLKDKIKSKYKQAINKVKNLFKKTKASTETVSGNVKKTGILSKICKSAKNHKGITAAIAATAALCIGAAIKDSKRKSEYQDTSVNKYSKYGFRKYY